MPLCCRLVSAPISLHWLWSPEDNRFGATTFSQQERDLRTEFVARKSMEMCHDWYDEDGALFNFIRDTETNSSCPCIETQARLDLGRFMPHPRCSQTFRDITCTTVIGSKNCYMSAQNIYGSYAGKGTTFDNMDTTRFMTHYGQVCCYDESGFLMQTPYQPVIKTQKEYFYNPGYPLRAYEFGTPPYMGQFEVPGLSVFHNDYMPYFLCCKFADFRCQMFYWRRPSSACQEYQPPATGQISGAGIINTIDNDKFIFNEPGVFNFLYIPKTIRTPEVRIQVRMERYPNRKVDFGLLGRYISQAELVQPTNATVVTGVLVYVNNVERGQPEIYVVLEEAQIGIRVRESYALDIDRLPMYQESMGMLDIQLSVPPQYGVRPDGDKTRETEQHRIVGSGESGSEQQPAGTLAQGLPSDNMFITSKDEDKQYDVFPEANLRAGPIYKMAPQYETQANLQYGLAHCPDDAASIISDCGDSVPCLYNYALLQSKVLAFEEQDTWNSFITERVDAVRQYNSCGAINIEYPEYMMKTPALASGYLQGDVARFDCYQSHWIKGDHEYKCGIVVDYNNPNSYRFEWNKGSQPWCRSRVKENYFKWITVIFSTVAIILVSSSYYGGVPFLLVCETAKNSGATAV
ncbi:unnamed protein product [Strongylus vulgaris]|uniref:AMOP domain-containing protein n=1 Tax=Strongylus vulgaris TaxID=40348 RepID=A0A3P7J2X8_STRVU|nr:unnamed protein product [Strongylus vulgaris]